MLDDIDAEAPWPTDTSAMTEEMPMTMPSMVSPERDLVGRERGVCFFECIFDCHRSSGLLLSCMRDRADAHALLVLFVGDDEAVAQHDDALGVLGDVGLVGDEHDGAAVLVD